MAFDYLLATTAFYNILNGIYLQMKTHGEAMHSCVSDKQIGKTES